MALLRDDPHDRNLARKVAPSDWSAPTPKERYDLVVLGGGTAGLVSASIAAGLGGRVALVERELLGGDCLNHGCVPSKALLAVAHRVAGARALADLGVRGVSDVEADFGATMERMRRLRAGIAENDSAERFQELGVDVFLGEGRFEGPDAVRVGDARLRFTRAVLATGGRPVVPPIEGLEEAGYRTNLDLFTLTERPRRLVVVGAGPIGCEMAQAFARLGSEVVVLDGAPRIMGREDDDAASIVRRALERDGVRFELGAEVARVERRGDERAVVFRRDRVEHVAAGDELLLGVGRRPNVEGLGLEEAGIELEDGKVRVDERLRTTNRRVLAAGDVVGGHLFTHAADAMARIVVRNAFFLGRGKASDIAMPWCTYTRPEVAHVGLYARESEKAGTELASKRLELGEIDRAVLEGETEGFAEIVYERKSRKLRGATVIHPHAGEVVGAVLGPVTRRQRAESLSEVVHPYPTAASIWARLGDAVQRDRLSPFTARVLRAVLRARR